MPHHLQCGGFFLYIYCVLYCVCWSITQLALEPTTFGYIQPDSRSLHWQRLGGFLYELAWCGPMHAGYHHTCRRVLLWGGLIKHLLKSKIAAIDISTGRMVATDQISEPASAYLNVLLGRYCTDMHCFIFVVSEKYTYRYAHWYAHNTAVCISDMHCAYLIHKCMYWAVHACICVSKISWDVSFAYLNES